MDPLQGVILGLVQGLTEFLPISSSGHLILVPWLLGWGDRGFGALTYDVALHMGTLAALLIYFWRDWWTLAAAWLPGLSGRTTGNAVDQALNRRLGAGLVAASIPAALVGAFFEDVIEQWLRSPVLVALVLLLASGVMLAADRLGRRQLDIKSLAVRQAVFIGVAQALALVPGVSRSGITISAGLALGLTRPAAARYAFLLGAPITAGAGLFKLRHLVRDGIPPDERAAFAAGIITSFVVGMIAIRFLLEYLRRRSLNIFIIYRVALAGLVLLTTVVRPA